MAKGPADHFARVQIEHGGQVFKAISRVKIRHIANPASVRFRSTEITLNQVREWWRVLPETMVLGFRLRAWRATVIPRIRRAT